MWLVTVTIGCMAYDRRVVVAMAMPLVNDRRGADVALTVLPLALPWALPGAWALPGVVLLVVPVVPWEVPLALPWALPWVVLLVVPWEVPLALPVRLHLAPLSPPPRVGLSPNGNAWVVACVHTLKHTWCPTYMAGMRRCVCTPTCHLCRPNRWCHSGVVWAWRAPCGPKSQCNTRHHGRQFGRVLRIVPL